MRDLTELLSLFTGKKTQSTSDNLLPLSNVEIEQVSGGAIFMKFGDKLSPLSYAPNPYGH